MATPFERRTTKRVQSRSVRVSIKGGPGGSHAAVDLSLEGIGVACPRALPVGAQVEMELDHRHAGVLSINAQVAWSGDVAGTGRLGLQFASLSILQRNHLRRLMAAEVGSCVLEDGRLRGFAVSTAAGAWAVFDGAATKVAVVNQEAVNRFAVSYRPRGAAYEALERSVTDGLPAAVAQVLAAGPLSFEPPLGPRSHPVTGASARPGASAPPSTGRYAVPAVAAPPSPSSSSSGEGWLGQGGSAAPPPPPPAAAPPPKTARLAPPPHQEDPAPALDATLQGSAVVVNGEVIGFVALTGKRTWSVYDPHQRQIAVLSNEAGRFTIFWLRGTPEDSLESLEAESFPAALAAAFDLDNPPELRSATISPQQRAEVAPARRTQTQRIPGVRVLYRHRAVGYLRPAPSDGGWTVFDKNKAQVALIALASGRWRVCVLGASPEDSLDFEDHDEFIEAVQASFKLPEAPALDPPITPAAPRR